MIPKTINFLNSILELVDADQSELLLVKTTQGLTRFSSNRIHQSTQTEERQLSIRLIRNGRVGWLMTDRFDQDSIAATLQQAEAITSAQPVPRQPHQLPSEQPISDSSAWHETTARATPYDRAQTVAQMVRLAESRGVQLSGALSTAEKTFCVVNSRGVRSYQECTLAELNLVASKNRLSGYSYWIGHDVSSMPWDQLAMEALHSADGADEPVAIELLPMTVVLDAYAAATLMGFLAPSFSAKAFLEGRSFMSRRIGEKVCSSKITLWDDGTSPEGLMRQFDAEGVAKTKVMLIDHGVASDLVTDSGTCALVEKHNSGHALPGPNPVGPMPGNLFLAPGKSSLAKMIQSTARGVYIRRFHYVNTVDPVSTLVTGMTRDGTFLIEDGHLTRPVKNLRFTQSILEMLGNVLQVGCEARLAPGVYGASRVPPLKLKGFRFTGISEQ